MEGRHGELISGGGRDIPFGCVFHTGRNVLFTTNLASADIPKPSEVVLKEQRGNGIAQWFDDDNIFPQKVLADIEKSNIIGQVLDWKANTLVGEGIAYGNMVEGASGSLVMKPMQVAEIERWLIKSAFDLYCLEAGLDFYRYGIGNAELQRNRGGEAIGCWAQDTSWMRLGLNDDRGRITKAYLNADWAVARGPKSEGTLKYEALDPYWDLAGQLANSKETKHLIPLRLQGAGRKYYPLPSWGGLRTSGTLQLASAIQKMKLRLIEYLMQMRFWIEIADEYWPLRFGVQKWKDASPNQRQEMMNQEVRDFEELMGGQEEIGKPKALMTRMNYQSHSKEMVGMWKVHDLKLEVPTGAYVEDGRETDHLILRGLVNDPALVGQMPGKNGASAGSGSADRVKRTNDLLSCRPHGRILLRPLDAVAELNNWNRDFNGGFPLTFMFRSLHVATQDQNNAAMPEAGLKNPQENGAVRNE
jgi:hypothetical protein